MTWDGPHKLVLATSDETGQRPASKGSCFVHISTKTFDDKSSLKTFPEDAHYGVLQLKRIKLPL